MRRSNRPFRIGMIPTANSGVNYYRLATWAFNMRRKGKVEVALFAFRADDRYPRYETRDGYEIKRNVWEPIHPWQRDIVNMDIVRRQIRSICAVSDIVIWQPLHYEHTLEFFRECRSEFGKPMLIECDDNYIDVPQWNEAANCFNPNSHHRKCSIESFRLADGLIVATPHLKELYSLFNENIHVVENSMDFRSHGKFIGWDKAKPRRHNGIRIGWIAGRSHFEDLYLVLPYLRDVLLANPLSSLWLINSAFQESCKLLGRRNPLEGMQNVFYADRSVPISRYPAFAAHFGFDVGLAPLVDCNFNRSKSNLRWLEYGAMGVPTVATDISHFSQTIKDEEDGILIPRNDPDAWQIAVAQMVKYGDFRARIGDNAKSRIRKDFNVRINAKKYLKLLKEIAEFDPNQEENVWTEELSKPLLAI